MTLDQLKRRNAAIAVGQRRAWGNPEIKRKRVAAIRAAWEDPLLRAYQRHRRLLLRAQEITKRIAELTREIEECTKQLESLGRWL
jgi:chromosome segregation ATPase